MATQLIQVGVPTVITQNVVYALPARQCFVEVSVDCQVSTDFAFTTSRALTLAAGGLTGAGYIRCTTASPTVICKPT